MATKKDSTKKKVAKKDTAKKSTNKKAKKIEKVVEEVNEDFNNLSDFKKVEPYKKVEVMNGDPSVITPIDESAPIEEPKPKEKIMKKISRAFGYFWNGQMIDF